MRGVLQIETGDEHARRAGFRPHSLEERAERNAVPVGDADQTVVIGVGVASALDQIPSGRVADFLELAELMCLDALERKESCGGHFREEMQTPEGETLRDDKNFCYVAAWEYTEDPKKPRLNKEPLEFEYVHLGQRNYK